jgi:membrane-associated phospholipid phosphatase
MLYTFAYVGDAALTLPIALACAFWIALSDWRLALRWALTLAGGIAIVGATKIIYAGWGIRIHLIGFRVVSGHTMLATAVWTVVVSLLLRNWQRGQAAGMACGLTIGAMTGVARVLDHAHYPSEVLAGWLVGAAVAALFLRACARSEIRPFRPVAAACALLLVSSLAYGHHAPFQYLIVTHTPSLRAHIAAGLSGLR